MATRTNPVYAHLAYRRALIVNLIEHLREDCMALGGGDPKKEVVCEEVFREDSIVPEDEIQIVVEELEQESEHLRLELAKFSFGKAQKTHGVLSSAQAEESNQGSGVPSQPQGRRKGNRTRQRK
jgi:hypothetical protein